LGLCCISKFPPPPAVLTSCYERKVCLNRRSCPFETGSSGQVIAWCKGLGWLEGGLKPFKRRQRAEVRFTTSSV
jgi:hypothetical protein